MKYLQVKNKIRQSLFNQIVTYSLFTISLASFSVQALYYQEGQDKGHLVSVELAKTELVNPTMWLPGNVVSRKNSPISAEQTGQLLWIEDVGKQVKKGDLIANIDNRHLKLQLARQQAQVKQHQANVSYLTKQQKRLSTLNQKNNTSLSELERIIKDLAIAKNEVIALEMQVKQTELDIEKSAIKAPFSGNISQRFAHLGELITLGRPLIQLVDTKHLDIKVSAPLAIAQFLQADAQVLVKWQDKLIELPVRTWSKAGDQISRTFEVRLAADDLNLIAGSAVTVSLPKQNSKQATMVPRDALVLRENETFVLTVNEENQAKKVNVLVGQGVGRWVSVIGALGEGEQVVVRGGERLSDGQKVRKDQALAVTASTHL